MDYRQIDHFYTIAERMRRLLMQRNDSSTLTKPEHLTLQIIQDLEAKQQKPNTAKISQILMVSKSAVSQTVSHLEEQNYVRRRLDSEDKRQPSIHLTKAGLAVLQRMEAHNHEIFAHIFELFGEAKTMQFITLLDEFSEAFASAVSMQEHAEANKQ